MIINNINLSSLTNLGERLNAGIRRTGSQGAAESEKIQDQDNVDAPLAAKKQINSTGDPGSKALAPDNIPSRNHNSIKIVPFENIEEVVDAAGELEQFKQSEAFIHEEMPELERFFRQAVTTIGVDNPEELGAFLVEFSESGIAASAGFTDHAIGFIMAAQVIAQHAPGTMESFISGSKQLLTDSPENLGNYFSRIAEVAVQFGSEEAGVFAGLFIQSPDEPGTSLEPEIMDEFFAASDAIRTGGQEYYSMFLDRIASDLETQELDGKQAVIYLEYAAGLAKTRDSNGLDRLLDISIANFEPSTSSAGTAPDLAVTGVDMQVQLETEKFGSSDSSQSNSANVSVAVQGMEAETVTGGIYQSIFLQEGMHVTGNQPVDIKINYDFSMEIDPQSSFEPRSSYSKGSLEDVDEYGFKSQVTLMAYIWEVDGENRTVVGEGQWAASIERAPGLADEDSGYEQEITFEGVLLEPGKEYAIGFEFTNSARSIPFVLTSSSGEVTINNISMAFENQPDYTDRAAVEQRDVPRHTVYLTSEDYEEYQDVLRRIDTNNDPKKITDQDLAEEQGQMTELMIKQQSGITALAQANLDPGTVINIFA